jgi:hypothetical protein
MNPKFRVVGDPLVGLYYVQPLSSDKGEKLWKSKLSESDKIVEQT